MADARYQKIGENQSPLLPPYKDEEGFLDVPKRRLQVNWTMAAKASTLANLCLSAVLLTFYLQAMAKWRGSPFYNAPAPPYCEFVPIPA